MKAESRKKSQEIIEARRKQMESEKSTGEALRSGKKDTILFGIEREEDGYRVSVSYVLDGVIVDKKVGASQLKHHSIAIMENYISNFVIDHYETPAKYFESLVIA